MDKILINFKKKFFLVYLIILVFLVVSISTWFVSYKKELSNLYLKSVKQSVLLTDYRSAIETLSRLRGDQFEQISYICNRNYIFKINQTSKMKNSLLKSIIHRLSEKNNCHFRFSYSLYPLIYLLCFLIMITILPAIFLFKYFEKSVSKNYLKEVQIKEAETTLFVSKKVAHDIRSPLTALNMVLYKIKASDFPQVILATKAVERINKIADDLLNKSDTRLNSSSLKELHTSLLLLIDEKMLEFQKTIDFKIKLMKSENKNLLFKGENDKIIRILSNLINNAKEACEKNQKQNYIFIESKFIKGNLQISIKDNGNGMSPDDLNMLGKLGYSTKQKELGTSGHGMGIYSAIDYLKTIDGSLTYESKQTKGTIATVSLAPVPR